MSRLRSQVHHAKPLAGLMLAVVMALSWAAAPGSRRRFAPRASAQVRADSPVVGGNVSVPATDTAYQLLAERVAANRAEFFVYQDADSGRNHGFPSGFFASSGNLSTIQLDAACVDDPNSASGCSADLNRLDRVRGTVLRISFAPQAPGQFAGVNIEEPENFGSSPRGMGYDLRGATEVVFDVRTPAAGGVNIEFGVGGLGHTTGFIPVTQNWTTQRRSLNSLNLTATDLANVRFLFTVVTNDRNAPNGATVLLDNIRFEPTPTRQQSVLGFPLGTQTFGVVPRPNVVPGRVPLPSDQVLRNLTTIYETALTELSLLRRGTAQDLAHARVLADALDYALRHDNRGSPVPVAPDGANGLHNGYEDGDIALLNDQAPGAGRAGEVRLAGFSASQELCGPSRFCLVLDGATGGNNAFALLALAAAWRQFNDQRYLDDARMIGRWIVGNLTDNTGTGYGGYYLGYDDNGVPPPKPLLRGKSIENNADIFAAFTVLAAIERQLGDNAQADEWTRRANIAGDFAMQLFDSVAGRFYAGTVPAGTPPGAGIKPDGPRRGNDIINTFDFLDSNSFTTLALAAAPRYRNQIDWRRPVQFMLDNFAQSITTGGREFRGFNIVQQPTAGPNGIAWEFTGQAVVVMRFVDGLYRDSRFDRDADFYLDQMRQAQSAAPFGDGRGLVASTLQNGAQLPPIEQCLSTPFQCIPERVGLAATTWAIFAEQNDNVLSAVNIQFSAATYSVDESDARATITVTRTGDTTGAATVDYATVDDPAAISCDVVNGTAYARCDYATTIDTLSFAAGETTKSFTIPIINDGHVEGTEMLAIGLSNPVGARLGVQNTTALMILPDNDSANTLNPINTTPFFVRQQYLDFLSREPETGGFDDWLRVLNNCPAPFNLDPNSPSARCDRIHVSSSFFRSDEFQLKGLYVYLFYKVSFGAPRPTYARIATDLRSVTGTTPAELSQKRAAFADSFAARSEFRAAFDGLTNSQYVDALLGRYHTQQITTKDPASPDGAAEVTLTRQQLVDRLLGIGGFLSRAQVLRAVVQSREVEAVEFNGTFVAMQYYGYLRRAPEEDGYQGWLRVLNNNPNDFRQMVNGFMNSIEYRLRFGSPN